jgi:hypothetical protein
MGMRKQNWSEMSPTQRKLVVVGGLAELVITTIAARDLHGRDDSQVRGPRALWFLAFAVQPFGPLGYLVFGRK